MHRDFVLDGSVDKRIRVAATVYRLLNFHIRLGCRSSCDPSTATMHTACCSYWPSTIVHHKINSVAYGRELDRPSWPRLSAAAHKRLRQTEAFSSVSEVLLHARPAGNKSVYLSLLFSTVRMWRIEGSQIITYIIIFPTVGVHQGGRAVVLIRVSVERNQNIAPSYHVSKVNVS
jgi:hypothetical protein